MNNAGTKHIAVVGAGAFGGWTALLLLRKGFAVTLIDTWGPGNSRSSSGGETRIIRHIYGSDKIYFDLAVRSSELWAEHEKRWQKQFFVKTGALWFVVNDDSFVSDSLPFLDSRGIPYEKLSHSEVQKLYPQVNFDGVRWVLFEKEAGYLFARRSCEAVCENFLKEGGTYKELAVRPGNISNSGMDHVALSDGSKLRADHYVFACGPWLGTLFPEILGKVIIVSKQEVFYFGTPEGSSAYSERELPIWLDQGEGSSYTFYGIPGSENRGFKVANDSRVEAFDPTNGERIVSEEGITLSRKFMAIRFPGMTNAPIIESRVCQYESTPDNHFIIDNHPEAENVWLVGGGSGHGFKHGPAIGEHVAELVAGNAETEAMFSVKRFL